jgi:hypothetical protein
VNVAGAAALAYSLRQRLGRLGAGAIADSLLRVVVASGVATGIAYPVWWALDRAAGRSFVAQIVSLGTALLAAAVAYLVSCSALRVQELAALRRLRTPSGSGA